MIVLENHAYEDVIGNPEAPFFNGLAERNALATRYYSVAHPSLPNYLALIGGSTFGIDDDCTDCDVDGASLATQMSHAGIAWRAYMQGLPEPCFDGDEAGLYAKRHNPFAYFRPGAESPDCRNVVPTTALRRDLRENSLPSFSWITPDLCSDAHDCNLGTADRRLSRLVPRITRKLGQDGVLIVTFDEGTGDRGCCGSPGGGHVATVVAGPGARHGARIRRLLNHYSLLATIEDRLGLPRLRRARSAATLNGALAG